MEQWPLQPCVGSKMSSLTLYIMVSHKVRTLTLPSSAAKPCFLRHSAVYSLSRNPIQVTLSLRHQSTHTDQHSDLKRASRGASTSSINDTRCRPARCSLAYMLAPSSVVAKVFTDNAQNQTPDTVVATMYEFIIIRPSRAAWQLPRNWRLVFAF